MKKMITERMVKSVKPAAATYIVYDNQIRGFGVRVTPTGTVSFVLNYSVHGRERRLTLGRYPEISATMARQEALDRRREIYDGHDPLATRNRARAVPTIAQFSEEYLQRHAEPEKRPISVRDDRRRLKATIVPRLGKLAVDAVTRSDVEASGVQPGAGAAAHDVRAGRALGIRGQRILESSTRSEKVPRGGT